MSQPPNGSSPDEPHGEAAAEEIDEQFEDADASEELEEVSDVAAPKSAREKSPQSAGKGRATAKQGVVTQEKIGFFGRILRFIRQVIAELKKVVTPTRQELGTYILVVVVFVLAVMVYVGLVDFGVGQLVLWVFGRGNA